MVDRGNLGQADRLQQQYLQYRAMLGLKNPHIVAFIVEGDAEASGVGEPDSELAAPQVDVSAEGIASPPQMITAIRSQIEARMKTIEDQLRQLGVTI